jgi:RNA polymerase sigma factor (sigma-70 family)
MDEQDLLARLFDEHRGHLRAVAYRMLGSLSEADDAVQEAWLRLSRSDTGEVENLGGWLTTVVARVCLNMLRSRRTRREEPLDAHVPDPVVARAGGEDPEHEALLADAVGLALLVVLDTLAPAERLAFVLHDMFAVPFDEIAPMVDRTPEATRQLASRARRRVRSAAPAPDRDRARQREVVDAFHAAAREGEFDRLVALLHPDVVLRVDFGPAAPIPFRELHGAQAVARQAAMYGRGPGVTRTALVNGAIGQVRFRDGTPFAVLGYTVAGARIVALDILADPDRLARLHLPALD